MKVAHSMTRVWNEILIRRPAEVVFDYVTTPATWTAWHPVTQAVSGATGHPLVVGEQVVEQIRSAGGRGHMVWTVRERLAPYHWRIEGESNIGVNGIITYRLSETADGTRFERDLGYWKPGSFIYPFLDWLVRRRRVWEESAEALRRIRDNLDEACEASGAFKKAEPLNFALPAG